MNGHPRTIEMEKRTSEGEVSYATLGAIGGAVLLALGAWVIYSAYESRYSLRLGYEGYYRAWETGRLLFGIALSLIGTAVASVSVTYRSVARKK